MREPHQQDPLPKSTPYPSARSERLIAAGRLSLAAAALLAIWLDPDQPARYVELVYFALAAYLAYALAVVICVFRSAGLRRGLPLVTHIVDVIAFSTLIYFIEGPSSPFFLYFVFAVLAASVRWQWRGTLWTAGVLLAFYVAIGVYASRIAYQPGFELSTFVLRAIFLAVTAALMGSIGAYEQRLRREMLRLAAWPRPAQSHEQTSIQEALTHSADVLRNPCTVLVWEEGEEPWLNVASWSAAGFREFRQPPGAWEPIVAPELERHSFLSADLGSAHPTALYVDTGPRVLRGLPLHGEIARRYAFASVISAVVRGHHVQGRMFWFGLRDPTTDDLVLAEILCAQTSTRLDRQYVTRQMKAAAEVNARVRVARDLHDGLLQSVTAIAMELQAVQAIVPTNPELAIERLRRVQRMLANEQREMRSMIRELKPAPQELSPLDPPSVIAPEDLERELQNVADRARDLWGLEVALKTNLHAPLPESLVPQVCKLINEAVANAARHGQASTVEAELESQPKEMRIVVTDNGHGFPFHGRIEHPELMRSGRGPATLTDRVNSLGGSLSIESSDAGARVHIALPLVQRQQ